jgi:hypothetical protein
MTRPQRPRDDPQRAFLVMNPTGTKKALFATAAGLLLTGCGPAAPATVAGGATPAASAAAATPIATAGAATGGDGLLACGLVSEEDATTALGHAAGAGTSGGTAALSECLFDESALVVSIRKDSKSFYDQAYADARGKGATDLSGVGDSAFEAGPGDHCTLLLLKGTTIVSILLSAPHAQAAAATLAKVAASKL